MNVLAQIDALVASLPDDVRHISIGSQGCGISLKSDFAHYGEGNTLQEAYIRAHTVKNEKERRSPEAAAREIASWTPLASAIAEVAK